MVKCRGCEEELLLTFLDLGFSPIANDLIEPGNHNRPETYFPLCAMTCTKCALVQLPEVATREALFRDDYVYFSSYSTSWLEHSSQFASQMTAFLGLTSEDLVIEVASNDGYLLQYFLEVGIQVLGVEPASGVAEIAISKGIPTLVEFFGEEVARKLSKKRKPKLLLGNNVLAHVPDIHDFIKGFSLLIADDGLITFEFPHLLSLISSNQFDTIYHEHYSYLSVTALNPIFRNQGLKIIDVEKLTTHGGSLRIFVAKTESIWETQDSVEQTLKQEAAIDPRDKEVWVSLQERTLKTKLDLLAELVKCKKDGIRVAAYGAAAKGNTLLNYSGIASDLIEYVVDLNPYKQGNLLPGSRIPIVGENRLMESPPDVLLILPWNLFDEIKEQLSYLSSHGTKFLRAIPTLEYS
jgi:hypothetical protein